MQRVLVTHAQVGGSGGATVLSGTCDVLDWSRERCLDSYSVRVSSILVGFTMGWGVSNLQKKCYVTNLICLGIMQG